MLRVGRFRHHLLDQTFVDSLEFTKVEEALRHFHQLWCDKKLQDWEWVALYIFIFSAFRRPADFLGGPHEEKNWASPPASLLVNQDLLTYFADAEKFPWCKRLPPQQSFFSFFCQRSLRSIPLAVTKSLWAWSLGNYPLILREDIPASAEVLEMQTRGRRCVSVLMKPKELRSFVEGRDALAFTVHDLIHADHFFRDPAQAQAQIQFSRRLLKLGQRTEVQKFVAQDLEFRDQWNYLISDMNSVPLHLFKTLKAMLLGAHKRAAKINSTESLSVVHEGMFLETQKMIAREFEFDLGQREAWLRLNTPAFIFPEQAVILDQSLRVPIPV
jgi:hypothetical protein